RKEKNGVVWFEFEKLQAYPHIRHAIFSRRGGKSLGSYESLNLSFSVGDDELHVQYNRQKAFDCIGLEPSIPLVQAVQVHQSHVHHVPHAPKQEMFQSIDAFITKEQQVALSIQHADCQAAILYDPIKQ